MIRLYKFTVIGVVVLILSIASQVSANGIANPNAASLGVAHGAHLRPTIEYGQEILDFNALVEKNLAIVMYFLDWSGGAGTAPFDPYLMNKIAEDFPSGGPTIMLTWQPINGRQAVGCDRDYTGTIPITNITNGLCDDYIAGFADALNARPERIILRFAHEMNITDSPWHPGNFSLTASAYVDMYQHVYDVFNAQGVDNVEWIWSPNYASSPDVSWNDLHNYYPGDNYVDWIGLSGYNWYNASSNPQPWMTFSDLYDEVLKDLACSYAKPQIIAEIGTVAGTGGNTKESWILDAYDRLPDYPFVRGIVWFNDYAYANPSQADFRVTTGTAQYGSVVPLPLASGSYTNAYKQGISTSSYVTTLPSLASVTPGSVYCGDTLVYLPLVIR